jgi:2-C-methyl-D-erythritol 4-phosphate cytidylyltransferase
VTYRERQRLTDIQAAIDAIRSHLQRGDLSDGLIFDAVRAVLRATVDNDLLELERAVQALTTALPVEDDQPAE